MLRQFSLGPGRVRPSGKSAVGVGPEAKYLLPVGGIGKGAEAPLRQRNVSARFAELGVQRPAGSAGCELGED